MVVDILDVYPIDIQEAKIATLLLKVNEETADFSSEIKEKDCITMIWKE